MTLTFNIADLHGRSDLAAKAYEAIRNYKDARTGDTIVFTGDYIDRGPDSKGVIDFIRDLQINPASLMKVIALKGNHETFMLDAYLGKGVDFWVTYNGGLATYRSYGISTSAIRPRAFPEEHIEWVKNLPLYYDDGKRLYVHAGISDYSIPIEEQDEQDLIWMLYGQKRPHGDGDGLTDSPLYYNKHVVHGHHQFKDGPKLFTNRSNFDTLAWWTGRLVIGVFDNDKEGGPIDTIEVIGKPFKEIKYSLMDEWT